MALNKQDGCFRFFAGSGSLRALCFSLLWLARPSVSLLQATTDLYGNCTLRHSGTSAAAPEAAGVFALALEAKYVPVAHEEHLTGTLIC